MLCAACSTSPQVVTATETVEVLVPAELLRVPPDPYRPVTTTADLVDQLRETRAAYRACAATVEQIAEWRAEARF